MTKESMVAELLDRESISEEIERRLKKDTQYRPVITVSREPGSGGRPIAKLLAKKMGFTFYDKTLIEQVAARMKVTPDKLTRVDEKSRSGLVDLVHNIFNPDYVSDEAYFRNFSQVILQLAHKGGAIIVGRGGNFIVPQVYSLRVQVVAPYRLRVARAVQFEHIDRDEARERIRKVTADRMNYIKQYFGKNITAPKYYDLTINTTFFNLEQSADLILRAYKQKFPQVKLIK
jgi:cytidylate kinase